MARKQVYMARHKADRRRLVDVVRAVLRLAPTTNDAREEVPVR